MNELLFTNKIYLYCKKCCQYICILQQYAYVIHEVKNPLLCLIVHRFGPFYMPIQKLNNALHILHCTWNQMYDNSIRMSCYTPTTLNLKYPMHLC